jgi:predicted CXXCH cytochrome family protein
LILWCTKKSEELASVVQSIGWHSRKQKSIAQSCRIDRFTFPIVPVLLLFFAILNSSGNVFAQEKKHSDPSRSCVSAECHAKVVKHKYLHGPLAIGQCTVCHAPLPGTDHKFKLIETEVKLCLICHKGVDTKGYMLHDPVAKGKCLGCHDPHGSEEPHQVRKTPESVLCKECHNKKPVLTRKYAHKPVAEGKCLSCHRAHESKAKNLLDASGSNLCLKQCHEKMRPAAAGKMHLASEDCAKCHRSHDSNYPALLTRSSGELCLDGCHKEVKGSMESSEFKHDAMAKDQACTACHRAHDNKFGRLLRSPEADLCFSCHDKWQNQIETAKFKHRPVSDNRCLPCHLPHGSKYSKLLFADYPSATISAYDPAKYGFCFSCHKEVIVRERYVENQTNFRNGQLNLHYLHVNRDNGGFTCRACHDPHASSQPAQIREKAPWGIWSIPINFNKNKTGGGCLTGCHKEYTYDRVNPVQLSVK